MPRLVVVLAVLLLSVAALATRLATEDAGGERHEPDPRQVALLRGGEVRYAAYVRAERASLAERRRAGDHDGAAVHAARIAPALRARGVRPVAVVRAAAGIDSLHPRELGRLPLLEVESHAAGAGAALDAVRDALWARDQALTGTIDERLATVRAELDRHRRGEGFSSAGALGPADRRRLAAALDALAWRLTLAADALARPAGRA